LSAPRCACLPLVTALLFAGCSPGPPTEPIVVGHIAPLSGPDKLVGEHARQGIILAVAEANGDADKINGRRVEVYHADDRGTAALAGDEAVRLVTISKAVALLGGTSTDQALQIARATQSYGDEDAQTKQLSGIPLVTPSSLPLPLAAEAAFSTCLSPARQGQFLARFAARELKVKHAAVVIDARSNVAAAVAEGFDREFAAGGERRADPYRYEKDGLGEVPARVARGKPDAVVIAASVADFVKLREGLTAAGIQVPLLFGGEEGAWPALVADPAAGEGVYAVTTFAADGLTPQGQEVARRYQERFKEPLDLYAASAYDGARLLFEAMRRAKSSKPERVRDTLAGLDNFDSLTGSLTMDRDDHSARRPAFVVQRQAGQTKLVTRHDADPK
jgi:branched-chain amino acid transport system substrate-binding protein